MDKPSIFRDRVIMVTGGVGTVGRALLYKLLEHKPREVRILDNDETGLFMLIEELHGRKDVNCFLGDVRDPRKLGSVMDEADVVFHAAAFKHVGLSEYNPFEAVQTNILGVQNVIQKAIDCNVQRVIFTSSDKAANPTNVMGTSKLMGERLITAANIVSPSPERIFSSTRFGNVLGSRGSVVPLFAQQIAAGGPVTLTDPAMTRFIMTTAQAADLIMGACELAVGGEVFISKMRAVAIKDLATVMIEEMAPAFGYQASDIKIKEIGAKPGEKMFEELLTEDEAGRSLEMDDLFVTMPAFSGMYCERSYDYPGAVQAQRKPYTSTEATVLSLDQVREFVTKHGILKEFMPGKGGEG